ncbi:hypothetical protein PR202_gb02044 [Eleusine coracana subsp. coracana]|uniref:Uncharacterized protein n=1 Tax=Eleusine coracana subsp. coracana TaxID=191504 RepID=A0AAV5DXW6_ELECO|nr:hypothetical protein PR202_gb02044 [Eleusine coracana subsp. coracana]
METTCGSLLLELQDIWDEVGEPDGARDRMLLELERECMEVYRRKVDQANRGRAQLRQAIAESEAELAAICSAMGEPLVHVKQSNQKSGGLLEEINAIVPYLEEMKKKKIERWSQIIDVVGQIEKISSEIRPEGFVPFKTPVDESDLTLRKIEELRMSLKSLEEEKNERIKQVMEYFNTLHSLCEVLGIDFKQTISEVHPSLDETEGPRYISNITLDRLESTIQRLHDMKIQRMQKVNVFTVYFSKSDYISFFKVQAEVLRLEQLKASKMKELIMKKKAELEEHRRRAHLVRDEGYAAQFIIEAIEVGAIDPSLLLEQIEAYIATVKEDAFSRKGILERVERWLSACEEEAWLEDYNKDDNRYNAGRGAHIMLKRAEKARVLVNKIPGMVDVLTAKIIVWEKERSTEFTYDGARLLSVLEEYMIVRHEKERERKRQRGQKKLQDQFKAEQELLYGSKPSRGSRVSEIGSLPIRKLYSNTSTPRKPFTQITLGNSIPLTPVQPICDCSEDENQTPKKIVVPAPRTPMTVSAPMQMATTALGPTKTTPVRLAYDKPKLNLQQGVEYSFEERRLAVYRAAQVP